MTRRRERGHARRDWSQGLSLLEILIGLFVVAMVGTIFSRLMQSTRRELAFSAEHFTAIVLSQKVMQDLTQENLIDPVAGFPILGIDQAGSTSSRITEGASVFFSSLEDRREPWRQIDPRIDGGIDRGMMPLFLQVASFQVKVVATREAPPADPGENRHLWLAGVEWSWPARTGAGYYRLPCLFASPVGPKQVDLAMKLDEGIVEKETCRDFFEDDTRSLADLAAAHGADPQLLAALGKVNYVMRIFLGTTGIGALLKEIQALEAKRTAMGKEPPSVRHAYYEELMEKYLEVSRYSFFVLFNLEPLAIEAIGKFDQDHLGPVLWPRSSLVGRGIRQLRTARENFVSGLIYGRATGLRLLDPEIIAEVGLKRNYEDLFRLLDLFRVLAVMQTHPKGIAEYEEFLDGLRARSVGRDPALHRFLSHERDTLGKVRDLIQRYPTLELICRVLDEDMAKIELFIKSRWGRGGAATP